VLKKYGQHQCKTQFISLECLILASNNLIHSGSYWWCKGGEVEQSEEDAGSFPASAIYFYRKICRNISVISKLSSWRPWRKDLISLHAGEGFRHRNRWVCHTQAAGAGKSPRALYQCTVSPDWIGLKMVHTGTVLVGLECLEDQDREYQELRGPL